KLGFVDKPGGRKIHENPKPLGGGVAIVWAFVLPLLFVLAACWGWIPLPASVNSAYLGGVREKTPLALAIIAVTIFLHVLGLIDDRKPLGPYLKLAVQLIAAAGVVIPFSDMR